MGSIQVILVDTCVIVWDALAPSKLSERAIRAINKASEHHALIIADISIWEISMLIKRGRLEIDTTSANFVNLFLQSRNVAVQSISPEIAELSINIDAHMHNDPADRLIAATSIINNAQLVTPDQNLRSSDLPDTVW